MKQNKEQNNMKVVGITGGVGSGKSVVMNILKEKYGAEMVNWRNVKQLFK